MSILIYVFGIKSLMFNIVLLFCEKEILNEFDSKYFLSILLLFEFRLFVVVNVNKIEEKIVSLYFLYLDEKYKVLLMDLCSDFLVIFSL